MGFTSINKVTIERIFRYPDDSSLPQIREIVVTTFCDVCGESKKVFTFEQVKEAFAYATAEFTQLSM